MGFGESRRPAGDEFEEYFERELLLAPKELTPDLYHYTSSEAAVLGILATRSIRMSPFKWTNDLWESRPLVPGLEGNPDDDIPDFAELSGIWNDIDMFIRGHSKVACFTQDWKLPETFWKPDAFRGWSHLSLWAHYGAGHTGVCLRFDRDRLVAAFEASRENSIHQFYGPVRYLRAERSAGLHGISLQQIQEFGVDAVALRYAHVNSDRVFFRKHADWASESEFRLVLTDLSASHHYVDISDALTGVVLGDAFPNDRIPALRAVLAGFENVEVSKISFLNRLLYNSPIDIFAETPVSPSSPPALGSGVQPRRAGSLRERMAQLEEAQNSD